MSNNPKVVEAGNFMSLGQSDVAEFYGEFNVNLSGFGVATVALERSYNDGSTWKTVSSFSGDTDLVCREPELGIQYRFNCTAYTSGNIAYRLSQ